MISSHHSKKPDNDFTNDAQLYVEERIVKVNGEITVRKYAKGKFIGKVIALSREDSPNALNLLTWKPKKY